MAIWQEPTWLQNYIAEQKASAGSFGERYLKPFEQSTIAGISAYKSGEKSDKIKSIIDTETNAATTEGRELDYRKLEKLLLPYDQELSMKYGALADKQDALAQTKELRQAEIASREKISAEKNQAEIDKVKNMYDLNTLQGQQAWYKDYSNLNNNLGKPGNTAQDEVSKARMDAMVEVAINAGAVDLLKSRGFINEAKRAEAIKNPVIHSLNYQGIKDRLTDSDPSNDVAVSFIDGMVKQNKLTEDEAKELKGYLIPKTIVTSAAPSEEIPTNYKAGMSVEDAKAIVNALKLPKYKNTSEAKKWLDAEIGRIGAAKISGNSSDVIDRLKERFNTLENAPAGTQGNADKFAKEVIGTLDTKKLVGNITSARQELINLINQYKSGKYLAINLSPFKKAMGSLSEGEYGLAGGQMAAAANAIPVVGQKIASLFASDKFNSKEEAYVAIGNAINEFNGLLSQFDDPNKFISPEALTAGNFTKEQFIKAMNASGSYSVLKNAASNKVPGITKEGKDVKVEDTSMVQGITKDSKSSGKDASGKPLVNGKIYKLGNLKVKAKLSGKNWSFKAVK